MFYLANIYESYILLFVPYGSDIDLEENDICRVISKKEEKKQDNHYNEKETILE